jgi:flagellar biosynthesis protein FlhG
MRKIGESGEVFAKLIIVVDKFLNISINLLGTIPEDKYIERAIGKVKLIVTEHSYFMGAKEFGDIARNIINLPRP